MTEPDGSTDDRAEQAFRAAFDARAADAPSDPLVAPGRSRRRTWWVAGAAAAAVVAAVTVPVLMVGGNEREANIVDDSPTPSPSPSLDRGYRWLGYRAIEVQVPRAWPLDYSPARPDCATLDRHYAGPDRAYVEIAAPGSGVSVDIGCFPEEPPAEMPDEFGVLPFDLWQPHVTLADPWGERPDGDWSYEGWRLTRRTVEGVQVTVLASPDDPELTDDVLDSAHTVAVDHNGCETTSAVQAVEYQRPNAPPVPKPSEVAVIAVCQYDRQGTDSSGLVGSRRIGGAAAESLTRAILDAPEGVGPDNPNNCGEDDYGDQAIVLRFVLRPTPATATPEAYFYSTSCRGNGIVDRDHHRQITRDVCEPIYAPPVVLWLSHEGVASVCLPPPR